MTGRCSSAAPQLICILLSNAVREPLPQTHSVSSYLWSYVPFSSSEKTLYTDTQFFKECLMLVLLLTNLTSQSDNPYKQSLNTFGHKEPSSNVNNTCFVMDLHLLYRYFCKDTMQTSEQDTLLLYTLIQVSCVTRGSVGVSCVTRGSVGVSCVTRGSVGVSCVTRGSVGFSCVTRGSVGISCVTRGSVGVSCVTRGSVGVSCVTRGSVGFSCVTRGSVGVSCVTRGSVGVSCVTRGSVGVSCVTRGSVGVSCVTRGSVGVSCVTRGSVGV